MLPEVVSKDNSPEEYRSVKYDKVVALLVEASTKRATTLSYFTERYSSGELSLDTTSGSTFSTSCAMNPSSVLSEKSLLGNDF